MNSSKDSLKSVVICGWVKADPRLDGCGALESVPLGSTLKDSLSIPRRMPFKSAVLFASNSSSGKSAITKA